MVDVRESTFSLSLDDKRGHLEVGVGSSSMEVEGDAVLVISAPNTTGVIEVTGTAGEPLFVMRTAFFPILDRGDRKSVV